MASALSITSAVPDPALPDLPWNLPLELWPDETIATLPKGTSLPSATRPAASSGTKNVM
jgi:hypothetical protein